MNGLCYYSTINGGNFQGVFQFLAKCLTGPGIGGRLTARGSAWRQALPKAGRKVSSSRLPPRSARDGRHWRPSPFSKAAGVRGQSPRGLALALDRKGGAHQASFEAARPAASPGPLVAPVRAAKDASRANLLTWEIKDFPSHREPQTVFRSLRP